MECCCCCSVAELCPTLWNPMDWCVPGFPVLHNLLEFAQTRIESVMPSNHLILCHPLLLLPSILPRIGVSSNELALLIRVAKVLELHLQHQPFQWIIFGVISNFRLMRIILLWTFCTCLSRVYYTKARMRHRIGYLGFSRQYQTVFQYSCACSSAGRLRAGRKGGGRGWHS